MTDLVAGPWKAYSVSIEEEVKWSKGGNKRKSLERGRKKGTLNPGGGQKSERLREGKKVISAKRTFLENTSLFNEGKRERQKSLQRIKIRSCQSY